MRMEEATNWGPDADFDQDVFLDMSYSSMRTNINKVRFCQMT